jgi:hydrogenase maturation protease
MSAPTVELLVLGLGNLLCRDDGAGVAAIERIQEGWEIPPGVEVVDGGTLGLSLLPWVSSARQVLLVDAVTAAAPPGTIVRIEGADVGPATAHRLSVHQVGVADLLDAMRLLGGAPERIVLVGIVPETIELGVELSPAVQAHVGDLVEAVAREAAALGFPLARRAEARAVA